METTTPTPPAAAATTTRTTSNDPTTPKTTTTIICTEQSSTRYPNRYRRTRPKKRRPPQHDAPFHINNNNNNEEQSQTRNDTTYKIDPNEVLSSCEGMKIYKRVLPSMSTMAALASASQPTKQQQQQQKKEASVATPSIPILHSFLKAIGEAKSSSSATEPFTSTETLTDKQQQESTFSNYIHNTNQTTMLTKGQHGQFLNLLSRNIHKTPFDPTLDAQRKMRIKEYKTLEKVVKEEQIRYCQCLMEYRDEKGYGCLDRFLIGFKTSGAASNFVHVHSQIIQSYKKHFERNTKQQLQAKKKNTNTARSNDYYYPQPTKYDANYSQSISLSKLCPSYNIETDFLPPFLACQRNSSSASSSSSIDRVFDLNSYSSSIVKIITGTHIPKTNLEFMTTTATTDDKNAFNITHTTNLKPPKTISSKYNKTRNKDMMINDQIAKSLAIQHDVNVVLTSDTFEMLLKRPGCDLTRWMIPLQIELKRGLMMEEDGDALQQQQDTATGTPKTLREKNKTVAFMEEPIPQPLTPRECLTRGFQQSLMENFGNIPSSLSSSDTTSNDDDDNQDNCVQYVYTLLTLPSSSSKTHPQRHSSSKATAKATTPFRILVRSINTLLVDDAGNHNNIDDNNSDKLTNDNNHHPPSSTSTTTPVHMYAKLEYFHPNPKQSQQKKKNMEDYTPHNRINWIMNKLLQPKSRTIIGRVDPNTATLITWEEKGLVDAFAGVGRCSNNANDGNTGSILSSSTSLYGATFSPSVHFQGMEEVVRATEKIGLGRYLLCYPGRRRRGGSSSSFVSSLSCASMSSSLSTVKTSVSIHKASCNNDDAGDDNDVVTTKDNDKDKGADADPSCTITTKKSNDFIDIGQELVEAEAVYMGEQSLRLCFCPWVWNGDDNDDDDVVVGRRVPFTFPMKKEEGG